MLEEVISRCADRGLLVGIKKCILGTSIIHFCGRDVDGEGFRFNPRTAITIEEMSEPRLAGELDQFLNVLNWTRSSLFDFAALSKPLHDLMESIKAKVGSREKKRYEKVRLDQIGWTDMHRQAFLQCKDLFAKRVKETHVDPAATLCMFTDASDSFWGAVLTQVVDWKDGVPVHGQQHQVVAILSGEFKGSQENWSTIEKESFPIVHALQRWENMIGCPAGLRIFTDHSNLVAMFRPESITPALAKSSVEKVYRWLYVLSFFRIHSITHIQGVHNFCADMFSRWANPKAREQLSGEAKRVRVAAVRGRKYSQMAPNFELPSMDEIKRRQLEPGAFTAEEIAFLKDSVNQERVYLDPDGVIYFDDAVWVSGNSDLRTRLLAVAHTGCAGHRMASVSIDMLKEHVYWKDMDAEVLTFARDCLGCLKTKTGAVIPRPFGERLFPTRRNQVISLDYMYIEAASQKGPHSFEYVLVMKDEYSGFVELIPAEFANHDVAVEALSFWAARYGIPDVIRTDGGSHFVNKIIAGLCKSLGIHHDITTPYCAFSNGSVERVNRELKRLLKVALLEMSLPGSYWPYLLPYVMNVLNSTKVRRLGGNAPRQVYMGLPATDPFTFLYHRDFTGLRSIPVDSRQIQEQLYVLRRALQDLHLVLDNTRTAARQVRNAGYIRNHLLGKRRRKDVDYASGTDAVELEYADRYSEAEARNLEASFSPGDLVLVALPQDKIKSKLQCVWRGPFRVLSMVGPRLAQVQHLVTGDVSEHHVVRLKFYADRDLNVEQEVLDELTYEAGYDQYFEVERVLSHRFNVESKEYEVLVKWKGFSDLHNSFEPLIDVFATAPDSVKAYLDTQSKQVSDVLLESVHRPQATQPGKFKLGDQVYVRGSYWKGKKHPHHYVGTIASPGTSESKEGLTWEVYFHADKKTVPVLETELARNITQLEAILERYRRA